MLQFYADANVDAGVNEALVMSSLLPITVSEHRDIKARVHSVHHPIKPLSAWPWQPRRMIINLFVYET